MSVTYNFSKKHFLVTGATSGIGQQNSWDLSSAGASLTLLGRDVNKVQSTKDRLDSGDFEIIVGDLSEESYLDEVISKIKPLDGLVLCAGIIDYTPAKMITKEKIRRIFDINFDANVLLIQKLLKKKKINSDSSIVIISSISCKLGVPGTALYAASKAAISAYSKVMASELSSRRIRVNTIFPGIVKTDLIANEGVVSGETLNNDEELYPLGYGSVHDVSNQIQYLLSDASKWVTGAEFIIDGGYTIK